MNSYINKEIAKLRFCSFYHETYTDNEIIKILDDIPTADVVEVVRCRECKYRDPEDHKCDCGGQERQGCPLPVRGNYFCADGERKDGGQDE